MATANLPDFRSLVGEEVAFRRAQLRGRPAPDRPHTRALSREPEDAERWQKEVHMNDFTRRRWVNEQARTTEHPGTPPHRLLYPEHARYCYEFVDYMGTRAFHGATQMTHRRRFTGRTDWSIRGYGIGRYAFGWRTPVANSPAGMDVNGGLATGTSLQNGIFICEDYLLRAYVSRKAADDPGAFAEYHPDASPPNTIRDIPAGEERSLEQMRGPSLSVVRLLVGYAADADMALARS